VELVEPALQHKLVKHLEFQVQTHYFNIMLGVVLLVNLLQTEELEEGEVVPLIRVPRRKVLVRQTAVEEAKETFQMSLKPVVQVLL
jgi:hypothetical protein